MDIIGNGNNIMCAKSGHMFSSADAARDCARNNNQCKPCPFMRDSEDMHWSSKPFKPRKKGWFR